MVFEKPSDNVNVRRRVASSTLSKVFIFASIVGFCAPACVQRRTRPLSPSSSQNIQNIQIRLGRANGEIVVFPLSQYVRGAVLGEVPIASLPAEAAKTMAEVQAILARTYAVHNLGRHAAEGFDLCSTTHCQVYRDVSTQLSPSQLLVDRIVSRTRAIVVVHDGNPIEALFHANCGGATSPAGSIWGGLSPPYLRGIRDEFCLVGDNASWTFTVSRENLRNALNNDGRMAVGERLRSINILRRDAAGRAVEVMIDGSHSHIARGEVIRALIAKKFGWAAFKSSRFDVTEYADRFLFSGSGHGHGAGLCQTGAMERARAGHDSARILRDYYPGTTLRPYNISDRTTPG